MDEGKVAWCMKQGKGIKLVDENRNLCDAYLHEADDTFENFQKTSGKWKLIIGYYACYNAFYSLLMRCGIQSEIHECTLELMELFGFSKSEKSFLSKLKEDRIAVQYYLQDRALQDESSIKVFISRCKSLLADLDNKKTEKIRTSISKLK